MLDYRQGEFVSSLARYNNVHKWKENESGRETGVYLS